MTDADLLDMRLVAVREAAQDVHLFEFRRGDTKPLPEFEPGAHVDLHLPNGMVRPYSLALPYGRGECFVVGVKLDPASRGGSRYMHEQLRVGTAMQVGRPRNNFRLAVQAKRSVFVAGGIGVTPIFAMVSQLAELGLPWELHYAVRRRAEAAFARELAALPGGQLHLHVDEERGQGVLDIAAIAAASGAGAHLYCCGPGGMLDAFIAATAHLPSDHVHYEYFSVEVDTTQARGGFTVELARSARCVFVPRGQTIVQALSAEGVDVAVSCEQGHCGACETRVIAGAVDHRDVILTEAEKAGNGTMMICVSDCRSETLVLDL